MSKLFTLAYPLLSTHDAARIEEFRRKYDPQFEIVRVHFTMVFGNDAILEDAYIDHVRAVSSVSQPISFVCRYAMLGADAKAERAYVFLVPDEGYSGLSHLHDQLYRNVLSESRRLDIPFTPHMNIGASDDRIAMKQLCDDLNAVGLEIQGTVNTLTIAIRNEGTVRDLTSFQLGSHASSDGLA